MTAVANIPGGHSDLSMQTFLISTGRRAVAGLALWILLK
jgi:hypothetical protein